VKSLDVKVWGVRKRDTKTPSYGVRWSVAGSVFSESFRTKALADHYRTKLMRAMREGEEFDTESGLPASMQEKKSAVSWYAGTPRRARRTTIRRGNPQSITQLGLRAAGAR
jgi:hypothetical protein